ncbi:MAG: 2OG-Fe(II) oxygenase [Myxococcota bacterium]
MSLRHILGAREVERLGEDGYFVHDGFLGAELARRVRDEARLVPLRRAGVRREHTLDDTVRNDEIAWLAPENTSGALREAVARFTALQDVVNEGAWLGLRRFDLQLARYGPGGKYVRHLDAFPGQDNRRLTAIVYLNDGWTPAAGGQLQVFAAVPRIVEPILDRLVVFRSELIEHEVLESHAERWALAAWYSAREG